MQAGSGSVGPRDAVSASSAPPVIPSPSPDGSTILIVDDVRANREFLVTLLEPLGHRLVEARDGSEALAKARSEHPDLVITDILMPVMDGYELVNQLNLDPTTRRIPVVFYTSHYGEREARLLSRSGGVAGVITKPAEAGEVLQIVGRVLAGDPDPGASPQIAPPSPAAGEHLRLLTDRLAGDLKEANARLRALINIGLELGSHQDSQRLLESVCAAAHDLFGATYVTLGIVDEDGHTVLRLVTCGTGAGDWLKSGDAAPGILRTVVTERRTLRGENPAGDPLGLRLPPLHPQVQSFLAAPIVSPGRVYGWICLVGNDGRTFTEEDEDLMGALSGQVGRIYENGLFAELAKKRTEELEREILERKQAEGAQRASGELLTNVINSTPSFVFATDRRHRYTFVNDAYAGFVGRPAADIIGRTHQDLFSPEMSEGFVAANDAIMATGEGIQVDETVLDAVLMTIKFPMRDAQGAVTGICGVATDISARQRAEQAHRDSEARYRALFEYAPYGIVIADRASYYVDANPGMCRMLGYSHDELVGLNAADIVVPSEVPEIGVALTAIAASPDYHREWQFRRKDGSTFAADVIAAGMPDGNLMGIIRDVTERNRATTALRAAEERMRYALEAASVGIWDLDYTSGILQWSENMMVQHGVPPGKFGGTFEAFVATIHPDDREATLAGIGKALASGKDFTVVYRTLRPDGTVRWLSGSGRVQRGEHGEPIRATGISLDVTDRHALEEQYHHAQKMEAVGRLAGGVAHDFNNLLTAILGYCELLLEDLPANDRSRADIGEIHKAGLSAAGLTRQLLAFSRKQIIEPTLLDLNTVVREMRAMLGRLIGEDVRIVLALRDAALVMADRGQVEQIVMNLAVNARDAMPRGGILTIETANVELDENYPNTHFAVAPGSYVVLTVTDTGTGITPEVQARLFEPFFTTKDPGKGTGLGLATVHGIVTRSGGSVNVYSEMGKGTSFKVYFPRATDADMVVEVPPLAVRPHSGAETVLLVEDAEGLRELTKRLLERQGYAVLVAANADEAVRLFEQNPSIALLLTDVVMPGVSGPELTRRLAEQRPELRVVYMSGYTEEAIVHHGVLNPGIAFLHKPFTSEALGRKIREALDR
jgi:two-component system cell cycle sensor histidine kinase/response regulator CckA